ncbi:AraC family transcriptional regulator [Robbsia sp. KACC 23696]|uniref:AraC family transcriptional regulator n=1 Tax=Robbsia sp. KACC 23696 TaxID=3149231 RepID=UPI00325BD8D9
MRTPRINRPNQALHWREPGFANAEFLSASYRTHSFPPHAHDEFALGVIERGAQAFLDGDGKRAVMRQGTICVINPGQFHEGRPAVDGGWDYRMAYLPTSDLVRLLRESNHKVHGVPHFAEVVIDDVETMGLLLAALRCSESNDASQLEKTSRLVAAIFQLFNRHALPPSSAARADVVSGAVKRAREYIDAHVVENPTLDSIALAAGMSAFHLLREFKRTVGIAPHAYLVQRRAALAKHLLMQGRPLRQVAIDVGYCDQAHLSREFRRFFGVPPSIAMR